MYNDLSCWDFLFVEALSVHPIYNLQKFLYSKIISFRENIVI